MKTGTILPFIMLPLATLVASGSPMRDISHGTAERQITTTARHHVLTNVNCWSRDGRWLAFDTRSENGTVFDGDIIAIADSRTGAERVLFEARNGARCGVVTFSPADDRVAFILGPEQPDENWSYSFTRRRGVIVDMAKPGVAQPLDAMNYAPPFTPGALRGGSHVHVFSPDGAWVSFTYEDDVLARLAESGTGVPPVGLKSGTGDPPVGSSSTGVPPVGLRSTGDPPVGLEGLRGTGCQPVGLRSTGVPPVGLEGSSGTGCQPVNSSDTSLPPAHDHNQRTIAVSAPLPAGAGGLLKVARSHPRNNDGAFFSTVVTRTVNNPRPGSDEISRAFEEGWIGATGYTRADGARQNRALAFLGLVTAATGAQHAEVFVVDLPDDIAREATPALAGSTTRRPAPPAGAVQRRLTFTGAQKHPGVVVAPRHWLRCPPDGSAIAFLMKDDAGIVQLFTISPLGGNPRQVTRLTETGIASAFTWSPDGRRIAAVVDGSVCVIDMGTGAVFRLTPRREGAGAPLPLACVFSPDGERIAYARDVMQKNSTHSQIFTVDVPDLSGTSCQPVSLKSGTGDSPVDLKSGMGSLPMGLSGTGDSPVNPKNGMCSLPMFIRHGLAARATCPATQVKGQRSEARKMPPSGLRVLLSPW